MGIEVDAHHPSQDERLFIPAPIKIEHHILRLLSAAALGSAPAPVRRIINRPCANL